MVSNFPRYRVVNGIWVFSAAVRYGTVRYGMVFVFDGSYPVNGVRYLGAQADEATAF